MKKIIIVIFLGFLVLLFLNNKGVNLENTKTPEPQDYSIPDGWLTHKESKYGYQISYPPELEVEKNGSDSIMLVRIINEPSAGPANFIYVSVVEKDNSGEAGSVYNYNKQYFEILNRLKVGESAPVAEVKSLQDEWFTYKRLKDVMITQVSAKAFENKKPWEFPNGTTENLYYFEKNSKLYIVGAYTGAKDMSSHYISKSLFEEVIATLRVN